MIQEKSLTQVIDRLDALEEEVHTIKKAMLTPQAPSPVEENLEHAYQQMAKDERRELEALEWAEATVGDVRDEAR